MSKPMSKHRTGGSHSGQTQSNQRQQAMADYQRTDRSYSHQLRQNNQQGPHIPTNSIPQMNMHSQHQSPAQPNLSTSQVRNYPGTQPNAQQIVPQPQTMAVGGHPNTSQQTSIMTNHVLNTNRNNTQFSNYMQNSNNRATIRPAFNYPRTNNVPAPQVQNIPQPQLYNYGPYNLTYNQPYMNSNSTVLVNSQVPGYQIMFDYPRYSYPQTLSQIMNQNEMINMPSTTVSRQKREKKPALIFDEEGNQVDLIKLAHAVDVKKPTSVDSKKDVSNSSEEVVCSTNDDINVINTDQVENPQKADEVQPVQVVEDVVIENNQCQTPKLENSETTNDSSCDTKIFDTSTVHSTEISTTNVETEDKEVINELEEKVESVLIEDSTTTTNEEIELGEQINEKVDENIAPSHDITNVVCETSNSGDMENETSANESSINTVNPDVVLSNENDSVEKQVDASLATEEINSDEEEDSESDSIPIQQEETANQNNISNITYDKDFLISRRKFATKNVFSNSNQESIKDIIRKGNSYESFIPGFVPKMKSQNDSYRNKSQTQSIRRTSHPSRNYSDSKSRKIMSNSLHNEYSLQPSENAWQPGKTMATDPLEIETEELLKHVRAILNKLTPQNYNNLLEKFRSLEINTHNKLKSVIDLIFDKAVKEPAFVVQYAGFCSELVNIQVYEIENDHKVIINFKNLLVSKCQSTFFKQMYSDIPDLEEKIEEIENSADPNKKKELEEILDDEKSLSRKRSVGNIKLIAELYKLNMLTSKIMFSCFGYLLEQKHEDYIEYLCTLITNIGYNLTKTINQNLLKNLDTIFESLKEIYDQKCDFEVSARVRFMILDLIDLRKNNWISNKKVSGPKTIAQIHEDIDKYQKEMFTRKKNNSNSGNEWQEVKRKNIPKAPDSKIFNDLSKILSGFSSNKNIMSNNKPTTNLFSRGSHGGTNSNSQSRSSSSTFENKYNILSNEKNQRSFHDSLSARDNTKWRDDRKNSDTTNYYQSENRDGGSYPNSRNSSTCGDSLEKLREKTMKCVGEYLQCKDVSTTIDQIKTFCPGSSFKEFIYESVIIAFEKSSQHRESWGDFLGHLFSRPLYDCLEIFEGFKKLFQSAEQNIIDYPLFWNYCSIVIAKALLALSNNDNRKKDVFKAINNSFGEIVGNDCNTFKSCLDNVLKNVDIKQKAAAEELLSLLNENSHSVVEEDSKLDELIKNYIESDGKNGLLPQLTRDYSDEELKSQDFNSALYYKMMSYSLFSNKLSDKCDSENDNSRDKKLSHAFEFLKKWLKTDDDQVLLLNSISKLAKNSNYPQNFLFNIFSNLYNSNVVKKENFLKWHKHFTDMVAKANVERFITSL